MSNYNNLIITYENGTTDVITLTGDKISYGEYQDRNIVAVEVPECVTTIEPYAFCDNLLSSITLNEGLVTIGGQAFQHGTYSTITIPSTVESIGENAFNVSVEQGVDPFNVTVTCLATTPPTIMGDFQGIIFGNPDLLTIYVPAESVELYKSAEYWSDYADKIQAIEPSSGSGCYIGDVLVVSGYIGNSAITYMYIGDTQVFPSSGSPEPPVPVEDPMLRQPLTVEITSVGTAATPILGLCLSGWTSSAVTSIPTTGSAATYITYTINDGAPQVLALSGTVSNSAVTRGISGVVVGDIIRFYATSGTVGPSFLHHDANRHALGCEPTIHTHFVHSAGLEANVYGNINSLLVTKDEFDLYAAGDDTVQFNASAYTFEYLFMGRSGFTFGTPTSEKHIVLPEPTNGLQGYCYSTMFANCKSLTTAPELPATRLATGCYAGMFSACTSLATAPSILPATTLAGYCYQGMFTGCTSLTTAPELPATTLAERCYFNMFRDCSSLTTAPVLPATTLVNFCYGNMFWGCRRLTAAPELPATTLAESCYRGMFYGCTSLNYIKCLATSGITTTNLSSWVTGVAASGTFVKDANATWTHGTSGIPSNWTVQDA